MAVGHLALAYLDLKDYPRVDESMEMAWRWSAGPIPWPRSCLWMNPCTSTSARPGRQPRKSFAVGVAAASRRTRVCKDPSDRTANFSNMENSSTSFTALAPQEQKRLLDKLAKLKALSHCPTGNVNETATAAAAMARIMLEYEIEMADLQCGPSEADLQVLDQPLDGTQSLRGFPVWQAILLTALAKVHHSVSYSNHQAGYCLWTHRNVTVFHLIGTAQDIENVRRLFAFCVSEIERLCRDWGKGQPVKRKNDFKMGASEGVCDLVERERQTVMKEELERAQKLPSRALQLFERKHRASREYARKIGIEFPAPRTRGVSAAAYDAGYEAGSNLDLGKSKPRLALPAGRA